jgi:hypothetical protein
MGFRRAMGGMIVISLNVLLWGKIAAVKTAGNEDVEITVLVQDSTKLSASVLKGAEKETARIFRAAGIGIAWVDCSGGSSRVDDACYQVPGPAQFVLHIVSTGETSSDLVFGLAFLDEDGAGKYSDVFLDRIEEAHRAFGWDISRLLGTVVAHELGHLLLGNQAHSYAGVMTPVWRGEVLQRENMGCLLFTHQQASRMRRRLADGNVAAVH